MNESNIVIEYTEDGCTNYMYFHADSEDHALEQFYEFFRGYRAEIVLVHCGYIIG